MLRSDIIESWETELERQGPSVPFACIVGAPRCGTTTLARLLEAHPDVSFSRVKEPHFFALHDLNGLDDDAVRTVIANQYLARYFPEVPSDAQLIAEGSVSYLYGPERLLPLLRLWPDAKFVISVRDPLELIPSLHQRLLYQGDETETDLERAWALSSERRAGRQIPRSCFDSRELLYDEAAQLGKHVERFFELVGRERCHVVLFDDLKSDPAAVHSQLLKFLGLREVPLPRLKPQRRREGYRIAWLQRLLKRPPLAKTVLAGQHFRTRVHSRPARPPSASARRIMAARKALLRWNSIPAPPSKLSAALEKQIRDTLSGDVDALGRLLGRDLSHWLGRA